MNMDSMDSMQEFDLGPLTWVKGEIDNAFQAAIGELEAWNGGDLNPLRAAAAHLHQVNGALQIVDLQGISRVCGEAERLLADMQSRAELRQASSAEVVIRAIRALKGYLDGLMAGGPNAEMALMPTYAELVVHRGGEAPAPSELFFPDISVRASRTLPELPLDDAARSRALRASRAKYQKGLLQYLRDNDPLAGLMRMDEALREVEKLAPAGAQYSFWWTAVGLMEALRGGRVASDFWTKRLCGRVDLQMRRLMEGSKQLAERLFRDVLYYVAQDTTPGSRAEEARALFQVQRYLPVASADSSAIDTLRPILDALRDAISIGKEYWLRVCGGRQESLEPFKAASQQMQQNAGRLPDPALAELLRLVQAVGKGIVGAGEVVGNEALQLEMATALLLAQHGVEQYGNLGEDFEQQTRLQRQRLQAAMDPESDLSRLPSVSFLDEISRKAQEKLLLAQVTHEIQSNLNQVEEILDKYFRNREERAGLPLVPGLMKQILGALNILQLDVAAELVKASMEQIGVLSQPDREVSSDELNWIADAISTLGLYIEALRHGRDDSAALRVLLSPQGETAPQEASVEVEVRETAEKLKATAERLDEAGDAAVKAAIRDDLARIARDAELIGDRDLRGQADHALKVLDTAAPEAVRAAVQSIAGGPVEAPLAPLKAPSSEAEIDAELLQIYLEEAKEVLARVGENLLASRENPADQEAFVTMRRGFHTLKGSGRMVGLGEPAEIAWEVEQTLNLWLRDERPVNPAILDFIAQAATAFRGWVAELEAQGSVHPDGTAIVARARALRGESEAPSAPKPEAGAAVVGEVAPAVPAPEAVDPDTVLVGEHALPAQLYQLFADEAGQRLADLGRTLAQVAGPQAPLPWGDFIRAAHTLAGISRTTGFTPLAEAAHEIELWAAPWRDREAVLPPDHGQVLEQAVARLTRMHQDILARRFPEPFDELASWLAGLSPPPEPLAPYNAAPAGVDPAQGVHPRGEPEGAEVTAEDQADDLGALFQELLALDAEDMGLPQDAAPALTELPAVDSCVEEQELASLPELGELPEADLSSVQPPQEPIEPLTCPGEPDAASQVSSAEVVLLASPSLPQDALPEAAGVIADLAVSGAVATTTEPALHPPVVADELDPELLPIFLAEADELLPRIGESLRQWRSDPGQPAPRHALQRALHTLKGSARMAGAMKLGDDTHALESQIVDWGESPPNAPFLDALEHEYDHLAESVERLKHPTPALPPVPAPVAQTSPGEAPAPQVAARPAAPAPAPDAGRHRHALKARTDILDNLINEAGEVSIARARIENLLSGYKQTAQELSGNIERLRDHLREMEIQAESQMRSRLSHVDESQFDPLEFDRFTRLQELSRLMAESVNDVATAQENLLGGLNEADKALHQQARMTRGLQQELMSIRMVRLDSQSERLHRIVRQAAKELGRKAQLKLEGGHTELDRTVLDKVFGPLEHLLRNAVAHGIEAPETRRAAGKSEYGHIRLAAVQESNEILLTLEDDGAGIDLDKVRRRAEAMHLLAPGEAASRERLESFLFMPGFSTAEAVTQVAGRGVGLDVVRSEIAGVGGRVRLDTEVGRGTRFTIRLPLTLALSPVVLAQAGDQIYALQANTVALVKEVKDAEWEAILAAGEVLFEQKSYPLRSLAELTGQVPGPLEGKYRVILLLRSGDERVALRVDALKGNFEAVVKNIGPQLARIAGVAGATVLGDGRVALILNPFAILERAPVHSAEVVAEARKESQAPLVLVVDDSMTVRKITGRMLEREGYRVATAKDGVEALEMLQDEMPAVMLLDIEMPRMDGFETARHIRSNPQTRKLPIIMITSRSADKHRQHAMDLGVDVYMGKPYQEDELLAEIVRLTGAAVPA